MIWCTALRVAMFGADISKDFRRSRNYIKLDCSSAWCYKRGRRAMTRPVLMYQYTILMVRTGWFKQNASNCVSHECRLQYLLWCHIFGVILTAVNSGRGRHGQFFCCPRAGASGEMCPDQPRAFKKVSNSQLFPVRINPFFSERAGSRYSKACL